MNEQFSKSTKQIELLAPAKDKACAFAAINAGADAVYIGAQGFGARKNAANTLEDIKEIVDYAHKFLVKIYVTVNTIVYDDEIETVQKLIWDLYEIGVDAIIIQDMGILKMSLPPIPIHASTQCNNDSLEKIKFLEHCNIERVVLPREFSLKEIKHIKENTNIELETFIHGALCVCYSGQCYLSAYIGKGGGRSANRGECAQPCRKKYSVVDEKGKKLVENKYLLSMKDLCMESHLKELIDIGVTSFKIEGRLKDAEYVKNVVSYYRKKIDEISPELRSSIGVLKSNFEPDINKTFNRGYTDFRAKKVGCKDCAMPADAGMTTKIDALINPDTPKFVGEKIGKVIKIHNNFIEIGRINSQSKNAIIINQQILKQVQDDDKALNVSDGLSFFDRNGELKGTKIKTIQGNKIEVLSSKEITVGTILYRNFDSEFIKKLNQAEFTRKIPITINIEKSEEGFRVLIDDYLYEVKKSFETAQNKEKAKENLRSQFSKLGESEFIAESIQVSEDFDLFIAVSELNAIRREFIKNYSEYRLSKYPRKKRDINIQACEYPFKEIDYSYNVSNRLAKAFYEECSAVVTEEAFELTAKSNHGKTLMATKHCIKKHLGMCGQDTGALYLVDEYGKKYALSFECENKQGCCMKVLAQ